MLHVKQLAWRTAVFVCAGLRHNKSKQTKQKTPKQNKNTVNENCSKKTRRVQFHDTEDETRTKLEQSSLLRIETEGEGEKEKKEKCIMTLTVCYTR